MYPLLDTQVYRSISLKT